MYELFEGKKFTLAKISPRVLKFFKNTLQVDFADENKLKDFNFKITLGSGDDANEELLLGVVNSIFKRDAPNGQSPELISKEELEDLDLEVLSKGVKDFFLRLV